MDEQIEKLEHGLMICEATGTELVHIEKGDAEKILALLKEQKNEYEKGFNDAMLDKRKLMYEGTDGKWYKKDW